MKIAVPYLCINGNTPPVIVSLYPQWQSFWPHSNKKLIQYDCRRWRPEFHPRHCTKNTLTRTTSCTAPGQVPASRTLLQWYQHYTHLWKPLSRTSETCHNQCQLWVSQPQQCAPCASCPTPSRSNYTTQRPYSGPNHQSAPTAQDPDHQVDAVQANQGHDHLIRCCRRQTGIPVTNASLPTFLRLPFTTWTHASFSWQLCWFCQSCKEKRKVHDVDPLWKETNRYHNQPDRPGKFIIWKNSATTSPFKTNMTDSTNWRRSADEFTLCAVSLCSKPSRWNHGFCAWRTSAIISRTWITMQPPIDKAIMAPMMLRRKIRSTLQP